MMLQIKNNFWDDDPIPKVENLSKRHTHYYFSLPWDSAFPSFPNDTIWRREDECER